MHTDHHYVYFSTANDEAIQFNPKLPEDEFSYATRPESWAPLSGDARSANLSHRLYDDYCRTYPGGALIFRRPLANWTPPAPPNPHFL